MKTIDKIRYFRQMDDALDCGAPPFIALEIVDIPGLGRRKFRPIRHYTAQLIPSLPDDRHYIPRLIALLWLNSILKIGLFYPIVWRWIAFSARNRKDLLSPAEKTALRLSRDYHHRVHFTISNIKLTLKNTGYERKHYR